MIWKELERKTRAISPYRKVDDVLFELPNKQRESFTLLNSGSVVSALVFDKNENVVLARQFRPGCKKILDELPGGWVDSGEDPQTAIKREIEEEIGYQVGRLIYLGTTLDDAYQIITRHAFLALNSSPHTKIRTSKNSNASEFIETVVKNITDFKYQLNCGLSTDLEVGFLGLNAHKYSKSDKKKKIVSYITTRISGKIHILTFLHKKPYDLRPQVPAGTIELNENSEEACIREVEEEVGLKLKKTPKKLGEMEYFAHFDNSVHHRIFFHSTIEWDKRYEWEHQVLSEGQDKDLIFCCKWLPLKTNLELVANQGYFLNRIDA